MFVDVERAGARNACLHLVENQHQVVLVREFAKALDELGRADADTALALDRLHQEAGGMRPDGSLHAFEIVEFDIAEAGQQRCEALVHLLLAGGADRRHRPAVEGVVEGDKLEAFFAARVLVVGTRGLDRAFDRFGARIREEHGVRECEIDQPLGQPLTLRAAVKVRDMHQRGRLLLDRADQVGMRMAEQVDRYTGGEIEIARAVLGDQVAVISAHRPNVAPGIDGHQRGNGHHGKVLRKARLAQTTNGGSLSMSRSRPCCPFME